MTHLSGWDRSQRLLLPEAVDDYVGPDNPVRFIEALVDSLDLNAASFVRVAAKDTGRPGYDLADQSQPVSFFCGGLPAQT
jgi:transposase